MSTRYVWDKYGVRYPSVSYSQKEEVIPGTPNGWYTVCTDFSQVVEGTRIRYEAAGKMDSFSYKSAASRSFSCSEYPYIICFDEGIGTYGFILTRSYSGTWTIVGGYSAPKIVCNGQSGSISFSVANSGNASDITKGSFLGNQSSQSSTQYPNNGIQNSV